MKESLSDRGIRILNRLRHTPSPLHSDAIAFIQELMSLTFRLEQERDDALNLAAGEVVALLPFSDQHGESNR